MNMPYTTNEKAGKVRIVAIRMLRDGKSTREVSRYLGYAQSTIVKWKQNDVLRLYMNI
jgi:transposase